MSEKQIADLISLDALPKNSALSGKQRTLIDILSFATNDIVDDASAFCERAVRSLVLYGDCTGLAYAATESDEPILCAFLRSEISLSVNLEPQLACRKEAGLAAVDRFRSVLKRLRGTENWSSLGDHPHPTRHRPVHFQISISPSPAYSLVAAALHRGICAKIAQLEGQDEELFDQRLGGFARPAARIALELPGDQILDSLVEYEAGEFDEIVQKVIGGLTKRQIGRDGRTQYSDASLETFWRDWVAVFYITPKLKPFHVHRRNSRKPTFEQIEELAAPEELPVAHPSRWAYLGHLHELEQVECVELDSQKRKPRATASRPQLTGKMKHLDAAHAALAFNPSPSMPGVLSRVILALIHAGLDEMQDTWLDLNCQTARAVVKSMLHLGRRPEWLLNLNTGVRPALPSKCDRPIYDPNKGRIYYTPMLYLGLPASLQPRQADYLDDANDESEKWQRHDAVYEPINLIYETILPAALSQDLGSLARLRASTIERWPLEAVSLGCFVESGPFWLWQRNGQLTLLDREIVEDILSWLTEFIRRHIPDYPMLRPTNFTRSFEGYYAHLGLSGVYRYYCSERARSYYEMPLRYSRVSALQIYKSHNQACTRFEQEIAKEQAAIAPTTDHTRAIPAHKETPRTKEEKAFFGSWHCPRPEVIQSIVSAVKRDLEDAAHCDPPLEPHHARYNASIRLLTIALALLNGLRPFEITRIKRRHVDLSGPWLAVRGKPHCTRLAFRRLPILRELIPLFCEILGHGEVYNSPTRNLIGIYGTDDKWRKAKQSDLEAILADAGQCIGLETVPDLYGFRHRFRTDMLAANVPEHMLNYLMGHENRGTESHSIYLDQTIQDLGKMYQDVALNMAMRYGLVDRP
jgi:integrase